MHTSQDGHNFIRNGRPALNNWYANPYVDLPQDGTDGLKVSRPEQGVKAAPVLGFSGDLLVLLEPFYSSRAVADIETFTNEVWTTANQAYAQWTRHLNYSPEPPTLQIGQEGDLTCHNQRIFSTKIPTIERGCRRARIKSLTLHIHDLHACVLERLFKSSLKPG